MKRINITKLTYSIAVLLFLTFSGSVNLFAQHADHEGCDLHEAKLHTSTSVQTPVGIMGDHVHSKGSLMFSYMYMGMQMEGLMDGRSVLQHSELHGQYEMLPDDMFMQMHMLGVMYAVTDRITLMGMVPFLQKNMGHLMPGHHHAHTMQSSGLGDVRLSVLTPVYSKGNQRVILNAGFSLPTGSLNQSTTNMMGIDTRMGYGMQNGTGTPDLTAALTYVNNLNRFGYGAQTSATVRIGENSAGYRHGNQVEGSGWIGISPVQRTTLSLRMQTIWQDTITGSDEMIDPGTMPTTSPDCYGGLKTRALAGLRYNLNRLLPVNGSIGAEAGAPIYQNLNGPQMPEQWMITGSIRISI